MKSHETIQLPLGKGEVGGSIPPGSTIKNPSNSAINDMM
jgi:hypothetical protein